MRSPEPRLAAEGAVASPGCLGGARCGCCSALHDERQPPDVHVQPMVHGGRDEGGPVSHGAPAAWQRHVSRSSGLFIASFAVCAQDEPRSLAREPRPGGLGREAPRGDGGATHRARALLQARGVHPGDDADRRGLRLWRSCSGVAWKRPPWDLQASDAVRPAPVRSTWPALRPRLTPAPLINSLENE